MLVAQSALVWFEGRKENLIEFIETGCFDSSGASGESMPYNPKALEAVAKTWKFGG